MQPRIIGGSSIIDAVLLPFRLHFLRVCASLSLDSRLGEELYAHRGYLLPRRATALPGKGVTVSLRRALDVLPDDRATVSAARQLIVFMESHSGESVSSERLARATGLAPEEVDRLMRIFVDSFVIDCAGSEDPAWVFTPTPLLTLEVQRYLRSASSTGSQLQRSTERFRSRYGPTTR